MIEGLLCGVGGAVLAVLCLMVGKEVALPALLHNALSTDPGVHALAFPVTAAILVDDVASCSARSAPASRSDGSCRSGASAGGSRIRSAGNATLHVCQIPINRCRRSLITAELARRGRRLVGEPYFTDVVCRSHSTQTGSATIRPANSSC